MTDSNTPTGDKTHSSISRLFDDVIEAQNDISELMTRLDEAKKEAEVIQGLLASKLNAHNGSEGFVSHRGQIWSYTIDTSYKGDSIPLSFKHLRTTTVLNLDHETNQTTEA